MRAPGWGRGHDDARLRPGRRLFSVALLGCTLLGAAGGLLVVQSHREMRDGVQAAMDVRAQFAATEVYGRRLGLVRLLQGLASDPTLRAGDPAAIRERLALVDAPLVGLTGGLAWADGDGIVRVSTDGRVGAPAGGWFAEARDSGAWTTSVAHTAPAFVGEVLVFAVATRDSAGAVNGVLAGGLDVGWLRGTGEARAREIATQFVGPGTELLVVDRGGQLIIGPGVTAPRDVRGSAAYRRIAAATDGFAHGAFAADVGLGGERDRLVGYARLGPFGEVVVLERAAEQAFAEVNRSARLRAVQILVVIAFVLVAAWLVGRRIDRLTSERDERYRAEHEIVIDLQRSLLTTTLPPGVTVRYLPAASVLNVGGDWYDAIRVADGRVFLIVGDVVGHGVGAALVMGQIRTAARALAPRARGPAQLLAELDRYVAAMPDVTFCTAACVAVDPPTGRFRYAVAGHPPGLVRRGDGTVTLLNAKVGAPLGLGGGAAVPELVETTAGAVLVLYTDGLVERRGELIDEGIGRLAAAVGAHDPDVDGWADAVIDAALRDGERTDDAALLAFRHTVEVAPPAGGIEADCPGDPDPASPAEQLSAAADRPSPAGLAGSTRAGPGPGGHGGVR